MKSDTFLEFCCLILLASVATISGKDITEKDLKSGYARLNKHLEKTMTSEDPKANMAEIIRYYNDEPSSCFRFGSSGYRETLKRLVDFAALPMDRNYCDLRKNADLAEFMDSGLAGKSRLMEPNYPLTRVDRILQYYAYQVMNLCGYYFRHPTLNYAFKLLAYDEVNKRLVEALPNDDDIERNVLKAEELLEGLASNGALADALRQFSQLKLTLNKEYCDERGYEILMKNDVATRRNGHLGHDTPLRRIDKIYQQYAKKHEQLCQLPVREEFIRMVKKLSPDTYRNVLGLVNAKLLESIMSFPELVIELEDKKIDEDFYNPLLLVPIQERVDSYYDGKIPFEFENFWPENLRPSRLYEYLKSVSQHDPDGKYLGLVVDEVEGKRHIDEQGLERVLTKYLCRPCDEFLELFGNLMRADDFGRAINSWHTNTSKDRLMSELTYHTVRVGYNLCLHVRHKMLESFKTEIRRQKFYPSL